MGKNFLSYKWVTKRGNIRALQIGAGFRDYKSGQQELEMGIALGISNRGRDFQLGQRDFKSGQKL